MILRAMMRNALLLGGFAVLATGLTAGFHAMTADRIEAARKAGLARTLDTVLPPTAYDNDLTVPAGTVQAAALGHVTPEPLWRASREGQPVAVVFPVTAADGYSGRIRLLVAIRPSGELAGVRVLSHRETPGLGDAIETGKSGWIHGFDGKRLGSPPLAGWQVRKDGGEFDQFTGATITPRAVVHAVRDALLYFQSHRESLLAATPPARSRHD